MLFFALFFFPRYTAWQKKFFPSREKRLIASKRTLFLLCVFAGCPKKEVALMEYEVFLLFATADTPWFSLLSHIKICKTFKAWFAQCLNHSAITVATQDGI